ncbi:histone-lysine N-methyltransferase SETMAR [Plakobranchus ocellatus]|uniref:Histone-lysine N-methyltransferase SETMAR n=1 Tax=Plakobranchus ocellatus TaxID=259542 RepID=A0AAV4BGQ5_9GAST|nr:histone-lysine N-methyltransferase SETMAR [Plakobranchus ocellatus]
MGLQGSKQMKVRGCQVWTVGRMSKNFPTVALQPLLCKVCDSMTWKHPSSPVTKKFKVQRSAAKVMATVFWDAKGVILLDILPQGQCINAARYCSTLDRLKEAIRHKRPGLLRRGACGVECHSNLDGSLLRHKSPAVIECQASGLATGNSFNRSRGEMSNFDVCPVPLSH